MILASPPDWMRSALCAQSDPDRWFPEGAGASARVAKAICRQCPVIAECFTYAMDNAELWGVWAATTERQRRDMLAKVRRRQRICVHCGASLPEGRRSYCSDECYETGHRRDNAAAAQRRRDRGAA